MNRYTGLVLGGGSGTYCVYRYTLALGAGIYKINLFFLAYLNVGGGEVERVKGKATMRNRKNGTGGEKRGGK